MYPARCDLLSSDLVLLGSGPTKSCWLLGGWPVNASLSFSVFFHSLLRSTPLLSPNKWQQTDFIRNLTGALIFSVDFVHWRFLCKLVIIYTLLLLEPPPILNFGLVSTVQCRKRSGAAARVSFQHLFFFFNHIFKNVHARQYHSSAMSSAQQELLHVSLLQLSEFSFPKLSMSICNAWLTWNKKWHNSAKKKKKATTPKFLLSVFHNNTNQAASNSQFWKKKMSLVCLFSWHGSYSTWWISLLEVNGSNVFEVWRCQGS